MVAILGRRIPRLPRLWLLGLLEWVTWRLWLLRILVALGLRRLLLWLGVTSILRYGLRLLAVLSRRATLCLSSYGSIGTGAHVEGARGVASLLLLALRRRFGLGRTLGGVLLVAMLLVVLLTWLAVAFVRRCRHAKESADKPLSSCQ